MKKCIKLIFLIALTLGIVVLCSRILLLKSEDGVSQLKSFYKQKNNTVDVLFLGSSHVYCDISTGLLWDKYGMASYDLGGAEAPSWTSYYHLKEALKSQRPEVIFYEISIAAIRPTDYPPEFWVEDNNYGMKWNQNRVDSLKENTLDQTFPKIFFPLSAMHGRYSELTKDDFIDEHNSINYKGFDPREAVTPFETPDISKVTGKTECSEKAEKYLRKIIELCKEEDIPLVFFVSPYVVSPQEQEMFNYMFGIGEEYGVPYIDFNKCYDEMGLDFSCDMAEELHLNYSGNSKFTEYIGKRIKEEYDIPDRRGNEDYTSWDVDALNQRMERLDLQLQTAGTPREAADAINKGLDNYVVFASVGENVDLSAVSEENLAILHDLQIDNESITPGTNICIQNGNTQIIHSEDECKITISNDNDRLLFTKRESTPEEPALSVLNMNGNEMVFDAGSIGIKVYDKVRLVYAGEMNM